MLPTLRGGLPSHWLSAESVESLRRWCDEESMPLNSLRSVVGRVVHVAGPFEATSSPLSPSPNGPDRRGGGGASDDGGGFGIELAESYSSLSASAAVASGAGELRAASSTRKSLGGSTSGSLVVERPTEHLCNLPPGMPPGERYYVVHAEMQLQHRWTAM